MVKHRKRFGRRSPPVLAGQRLSAVSARVGMGVEGLGTDVLGLGTGVVGVGTDVVGLGTDVRVLAVWQGLGSVTKSRGASGSWNYQEV